MRKLQTDDNLHDVDLSNNRNGVDTEDEIEDGTVTDNIEHGNVKYIFFDIETLLIENEHVIYLIVSQKVCNVCLGVEQESVY